VHSLQSGAGVILERRGPLNSQPFCGKKGENGKGGEGMNVFSASGNRRRVVRKGLWSTAQIITKS